MTAYINKFVIVKFDDDNHIVLTFVKEKQQDTAFKVLDSIRKNRKKYFNLIPIIIEQTEDNIVKDFLGYHINNKYTLFKPSIYKKTMPAFVDNFYVLRFHKPKRRKTTTKVRRRTSLKVLKKIDIEGFLAEQEDNMLSNRKLFNMENVGLDVEKSISRKNPSPSRIQIKKRSITVKKKLNKDIIKEDKDSEGIISDSELSEGEEIQIFINNTEDNTKRPKSFQAPYKSHNKSRNNSKSSKNSGQKSSLNSKDSNKNTTMLDLYEFKTQMRLKSFDKNKKKRNSDCGIDRLRPGINVGNQMSLPNYGIKRKMSKGKNSTGSILSGKKSDSYKSKKGSSKSRKNSLLPAKPKKRNSDKTNRRYSTLETSSKGKKSKSKGKK